MANLLNQNVALNYKGVLNLDSTINTPLDTTLRAVTDGMGTSSLLQLSTEQIGLARTVNLSAGATTPRLFNIAYTINNSGAQTGTLTGIFLNATETALNGITHYLMDLQVGGVSKFKIFNSGESVITNNMYISGASSFVQVNKLRGPNGYYQLTEGGANGTALLTDSTGLSFNRLQLGGTTLDFPSIKRNGTAIDFRLANDSGYCGINTGAINVDSFSFVVNSSISYFQYGLLIGASGSYNASSVLELRSTTKGFLMPRQNQAQILAIVAPAAGLMVYNTDLQAPCFYDGTAARWERCSHSVM